MVRGAVACTESGLGSVIIATLNVWKCYKSIRYGKK